MSCNCKSKTSCTCGSALTGDTKYDGLGFKCLDSEGEVLWELKAGDTASEIYELHSELICQLLDYVSTKGTTEDPENPTEPDVPINDDTLGPPKGGTPGTDGTDGSEWFSDTGDPSGSLGRNGDFYLRSSNGNVFQKTELNGWGSPIANIKGTTGTNGTNGDDGKSVINGTGVPGAGIGKDGDTYIDLAAPLIDIYTKAAGVWSATGLNFKGDTGVAGTNGVDGDNGLSFVQGTGVPSGADGNTGDSYLDSVTGDLYIKADPTTWVVTGNIYTAPVGLSHLFNAAKITEQSVVGINDVIQLTFSDDSSTGRFDYGGTWVTDTWTSPGVLADVTFKGVFNLKVTGVDGVSANDVTITVKKNGVSFGTFTFDIPAGTADDTIIPVTFETALTAFAASDLVVVELSTLNAPEYGTFVGVAQTGDIFFNVQE